MEEILPASPSVSAGPSTADGESALGIRTFFSTLRRLILAPTEYFKSNARAILSSDGVAPALVFAVVIHWFAAVFNFFYSSLMNVFFRDSMDDLFRISGTVFEVDEAWMGTIDTVRSQIYNFLFGAGMILLKPFSVLFQLALSALLVHIAVWLLVKDTPETPTRYSTTLKILAYASAPWVFCVIPGLGTLLAYVLSFFVALIGIREVYRTSSGRAMVAVLFPEILVVLGFMVALVIAAFFAIFVFHLVF